VVCTLSSGHFHELHGKDGPILFPFNLVIGVVCCQIKYLQSSLALNFRSRLTKHVHDAYMDSKTYYKVSNLDSRIENADQ